MASMCFARRRFFRSAAAVVLGSLLMLLAPSSFAQGISVRIGIIGSGKLGGTVGALWVQAGHEVLFSSRHPEELKEMAAKLGPKAHTGTVAEAIAYSDVLLLAVPYGALPDIGRDYGQALAGKIIIDASNPVARRDGAAAEEALAKGIGATSQKYLPGTRYVRAFNPVGTGALERENHRAANPIGMPVAGDDEPALVIATQLVRDAGFVPVVVPLSRANEIAPGTPLFGKASTVDEWRQYLRITQ